jgi:hypothetical protein
MDGGVQAGENVDSAKLSSFNKAKGETMENLAISAGLEVPAKADSQSLNRWIINLFSAAEAIKQGPPMEASSRALSVRCWRELAEKIGTERFKSAYDHCMLTTKFVPDISELRWAAGIYPENPIEREAMDGFTAVIKAMRIHGPQLRGMVSEHGEIAAPVFWAVAEAAIAELGFGDRAAGLELIARHPALNLPSGDVEYTPEQHHFRHRLGQDLERHWVQAYSQCKALSQRSV